MAICRSTDDQQSISSLGTFFSALTTESQLESDSCIEFYSASNATYDTLNSQRPSSISTDYGLYYTRLALSQEDSINGSEDYKVSHSSSLINSTGKHSDTDIIHDVTLTRQVNDTKISNVNAASGGRGMAIRFSHLIISNFFFLDSQWGITLQANRHTYVGRGKSSAEATKRAVRKVLEGLSSRPGYGPIHRFDRGPSTTGSHLRLAAFCQLMEWDVPLYKYTLKVASSKVWRTTKYTYVVIVNGKPYAWASGYKHDWAQERAAAHALGDLTKKYANKVI